MDHNSLSPLGAALKKIQKRHALFFFILVALMTTALFLASQSKKTSPPPASIFTNPPSDTTVMSEPATHPFGKSAEFDGTSSYILVAPDKLSLQGPLTVEAWVKPEFGKQPNEIMIGTVIKPVIDECRDMFELMAIHSFQNTNSYDLHLNISYGQNGNTTSTGPENELSSQPYGIWHHVAFTLDTNNTYTEFVDGKKITSKTLPGTICDPHLGLVFGAGIQGNTTTLSGNSAFKGELDEIRISKSMRYTTDFARPILPFAPDTDTIGLWHFDDTTNDSSTIGNLVKSSHAIRFVDSTVPATSPMTISPLPSGSKIPSPACSALAVTSSDSDYDGCAYVCADGYFTKARGNPSLSNNQTACRAFATTQCAKRTECISPTKTSCNGVVESIAYNNSCGSNQFRSISFTCSDKKVHLMGGNTSCNDLKTWYNEAAAVCNTITACPQP